MNRGFTALTSHASRCMNDTSTSITLLGEEPKKETLAAAARAPAIAALIAASIARHDGAALRTQRRIRGHHIERQLLLRIGLRGTQRHALARLAHGTFRTQELGAHPAEDVIHDGFRVRDLLIPRPPARLESHVGELIH